MRTPCFPTVKEVAAELAWIQDLLHDDRQDETEVRLQVTEDSWEVHYGDPGYDTDHRGFWGSGILTTSSDVEELAEELLEQVEEDYATEGGAA
jgi:hypothetical protein